jgi:DinB superfamily
MIWRQNVTTNIDQATTESLAQRLESVNTDLAAILRRPDVAQRLRAAGPDEWSAMQILGHLIEMIPYWMRDARTLVAASGAPPQFGRTLEAPERLDGVQRGEMSDPDELMGLLDGEIHAAATDIRGMSAADLAKKGIHLRRGEMTVSEVIETLIVAHAEGHVDQAKQVLGGPA